MTLLKSNQCVIYYLQMWVYEEEVTYEDKQQKLTTIINTHHQNIKYLPNIKLPTNLIANPSLEDAVHDSTILIFNLPHQFIRNLNLVSLLSHVDTSTQQD